MSLSFKLLKILFYDLCLMLSMMICHAGARMRKDYACTQCEFRNAMQFSEAQCNFRNIMNHHAHRFVVQRSKYTAIYSVRLDHTLLDLYSC